MGSTKVELVADLRKKAYCLKREYVLKRALAGEYHDYDSNLPAPKMQLVADLQHAGYTDLAELAMNGAYDDEHPTAAQLEVMRIELGPELYDRMFGKKGRGDA